MTLNDREKLHYATEFSFDKWKISYLQVSGAWAIEHKEDDSFLYVTKSEGFWAGLDEAFDKAVELYNQRLSKK